MLDLSGLDELLDWMKRNGVRCARCHDLEIDLDSAPVTPEEHALLENMESEPLPQYESAYDDPDLYGGSGKVPRLPEMKGRGSVPED
jgi:hypothetical protein